ncbi:MAG TPA: hypothetical protein VEC12_14885 [Bacteroidia bacterium]|nr:hypothetical protein [Bacteroidia bacterium]
MRYCLLLFVIILILQSGCTFYQFTYINQLPHDPAFQKKKEFTAAASAGVYGGNIQASGSPVNYLALTAGFYKGAGKRSAYNYGAILYYPVWTNENMKVFLSAYYERTGASLSGVYTKNGGYATNVFNARVNYTGYNTGVSVYVIEKIQDFTLRYGVSAGFINTFYPELITKENYISKAGDTIDFFKTRQFIIRDLDARNITFTGKTVRAFLECSFGEIPFGLGFYAGLTPRARNYRQIRSSPISGVKIPFENSIYFSMCLRFRI